MEIKEGISPLSCSYSVAMKLRTPLGSKCLYIKVIVRCIYSFALSRSLRTGLPLGYSTQSRYQFKPIRSTIPIDYQETTMELIPWLNVLLVDLWGFEPQCSVPLIKGLQSLSIFRPY